MKKIVIPISVLFTSVFFYAQSTGPSSGENYIQIRTYLEPVAISSPNAKQFNTVNYFDGLGRPKQVVNVKASPTGKDVVTHIEYDGFGRQTKDFLPVPQQGTQNGSIYTSPLGNATQPTVYGSEKIYAEKVLENSPLDRIVQQKQVGTAWSDKPVQFGYNANIPGDAVKKYGTVTTWEQEATKSEISQSINYGNGELYKNTIVDEDGNKTIEFKNDEGQIILVRKVLNDTQNADTYYVYNEYNQLAFVIPPLAAPVADVNTVLSDLCYQYKYDGRNRLVEKKVPGKGWEYLVYDKADRLVLTQDANIRPLGNWLLTRYDRLSRVVYTAIAGLGNTYTRKDIQDAVNFHSVTATSLTEERTASVGFTKNGMDIYYGNNAFPTAILQVLSVNYYDTYPGYGFNPPFPADVLGETTLTDTSTADGLSTKGLPVMSLVKNIENDNWTKNYTYYDKRGRSIGSYSINHLGGYTKTESLLDFAGVPKKINTYHMRKTGEVGVSVQERFVYDNQNRLKQHFHQVDGNPEELLTENTYNELSQLSNKKVGNNLQSIDYAYNIRGWLTDINKAEMTVSNLNGKLFAYTIKYNQKEGIANPDPVLFAGKNVAAKYNGNIAEVDWRAVETLGQSPSLTPKRYGYAYDPLNRLRAGYYQNPNNPNSKENTESIDYDLNGNITNLYRTSIMEAGNTATAIDRLEYTYASGNKSNRLTNIVDIQNNPTGYEGGGQEIKYDLNGNMTDMPDKGISKIAYNYLNLPDQLNYAKGIETVTVNTKYGSDGSKLQKQNTTKADGSSGSSTLIKTTDYLDGFQYLKTENIGIIGMSAEMMSNLETSRALEMQAFSVEPMATTATLASKTRDLQFFPTEEGFYDYIKDQYIYQYKDHLGNIRVSFSRSSAGALEITDSNDYYPFGMNHLKTGFAFFSPSAYKNYKYNGKELQETGMYDYGARMYMSDIGRWGVVDPLAETSRRWSPYNYAYNNPIRFIDPDGREVKDWYQKNGTMQLQYFEGSGEREGYTNVGTNPTVYSRSSSDSASAELSADGSATFEGKGYTDGDSFNVGPFTVTTGKQDSIPEGFDIMKWLSNLGDNKENFFMFTGGANDPNPTENNKKVKPGDTFESNDMFQTIFSFYGRNTKLTGGITGFEEALVQFGLDVESIGNPLENSSGSDPVKSDTFNVWTRQGYGLERKSDGSPYGLKYRNVRGFGLSRHAHDSIMKTSQDSTDYWNRAFNRSKK
ncbi:DUF6443 domain-containing protein [Chryseobacterium gregarium]|uniref:DUF6443 domain-containing protein n=1 Tax=Chryseobacterium gregarium TaxID=456299 RepID=UPI0006851884|nr:DUF6443 domain-containing protein [Chryseobacterium gregarium]